MSTKLFTNLTRLSDFFFNIIKYVDKGDFMGSVNRKDIATLAGVSTTTVTNVMNNRSNVSLEVKNKILKLATELNYKPNALAKALSMKRSEQIGVLVNQLINPFFASLFENITEELHKSGFRTIALNGSFIDVEYITDALNGRIDGLIILDGSLALKNILQLKKNKVPFVSHGYESQGSFNSIEPDYFSGMNQIISYLNSKNHKNIAFLTPKEEDKSYHRYTGFCNSMKHFNLPICENSISIVNKTGVDEADIGYECMLKVLEYYISATAVVCYSDQMAIGAYRAIIESKLRIPEDISVVGWDNVYYSKFMSPPLTTINTSTSLMAKAFIKNITRQLNEENVPLVETLQVNLVVRDSVCIRDDI